MKPTQIFGFVILSDRDLLRLKEIKNTLSTINSKLYSEDKYIYDRYNCTFHNIFINIQILLNNYGTGRYRFSAYMLTIITYQVIFLYESFSPSNSDKLKAISNHLQEIISELTQMKEDSSYDIKELLW